jgi:cytochrome c biogenesis factor
MTPEIGHFALVLSMFLVLTQAVVPLFAVRRLSHHHPRPT